MGDKKSIASLYLEFSGTDYPHVLAMQKLLIINDISLTEDADVRQSKEAWLMDWEASVCEGLKIETLDISEREIGSFLKNQPPSKAALFLLEIHAFVPYFPLSDRGSGVSKKEAFTEAKRKLWSARIDAFHLQAKQDPALLNQIRAAYSLAIREIPGTDWKSLARNLTIIAGSAVVLGITGGIAAPWIGGIIGSTFLGLSGAAATSAGLALLGGGALAVGGTGILGGTVVVVGGGAILGSVIGKAFVPTSKEDEGDVSKNLAAFDTNFLIVQSAKIETICKCAVAKSDLDEFVRTVLRDYRDNIQKLQEMLGLGPVLKKKFKNLSEETLKRNLRILENAYKRLREVF